MILNNGAAGSNMQNFEGKRKQLFDCLDTAEKDLKGTILDQSDKLTKRHDSLISLNDSIDGIDNDSTSGEYSSKSPRKIRKLQGKESIFKKPELPLVKCLKPRVVPDYQINPHKWKKYSLDDVDISDGTNASAAFAFLKEIEIRKDRESSDLNMKNDSNSKPVFNKSVSVKRSLKKNIDSDEEKDIVDKPKLKGSKLVMPEYSFGTKLNNDKVRLSSKKNKNSTCMSAKQLRLSHLEDDYNDNDDDEGNEADSE